MNSSKLKLNLLVLFLFLSALPMSHAVISVQTPTANKAEITKATFEEHLGRKLTFSERIAFKIFNKKIKRIARSKKYRTKTKADNCAKIALKTGEILEVDLLQISPTEVKYKRCNKPEDPEFVVNKKDIFSIQSSDGEILYIDNNSTEKMAADAQEKKETSSLNNNKNKETHGLAVSSLALSILSLLLLAISPFALLLAILAIVLGVISQRKIKKSPTLYKGKHLAGAGLVLGSLICGLYLLITLLFFAVFI